MGCHANIALMLTLVATFQLGAACPSWAAQQAKAPAAAVFDDEDDYEAPDLHAYMPLHGSLTKSARPDKAPLYCLRVSLERELQGSIETSDIRDPLMQATVGMIGTALARDAAIRQAGEKVSHHNSAAQRTLATTKDALNILTYYRGFGPSSEAGDVLLDEKLKVKSLASAEYAHQKLIDEKQLSITQAMMQVATGLGAPDARSREEIVASGMDKLSKTVGEDESKKTLEVARKWLKRIRIPDELYKSRTWDPEQQEAKLKIVEEAASKNDPVLKKVRAKLKKYNGHSKAMMALSHLVEGTLGVVSLAPNIAGPGAVAALTAFELSTGGQEEDKLIKEIYLYKRIESRFKVLSKKARMALHNYQLGVATHNAAQVAFAEAIVEEMSGEDTAQQVFGRPFMNN